MLLGAFLAALYYVGVVVIAFSYWLVEPVRFAVLDCVYAEHDRPFGADCGGHDPSGRQAGEVSIPNVLLLPLVGHTITKRPDSNWDYLRDEALVDEKQYPRIDEVLDVELTFARLLRSTGVFALATVFISFFKVTLVFVRSFKIWRLHGRRDEGKKGAAGKEGKGNRVFRNWIADIKEVPTKRNERIDYALANVIAPQALILAIALVLYLFSMISYRTIEFEYSSIIHDAAITNWPVAKH